MSTFKQFLAELQPLGTAGTIGSNNPNPQAQPAPNPAQQQQQMQQQTAQDVQKTNYNSNIGRQIAAKRQELLRLQDVFAKAQQDVLKAQQDIEKLEQQMQT